MRELHFFLRRGYVPFPDLPALGRRTPQRAKAYEYITAAILLATPIMALLKKLYALLLTLTPTPNVYQVWQVSF